MQQVQALRWKSTSDVNKETPGRAERPNDEFLCEVNCFLAHVRIKTYMIDQFETWAQRSRKRNRWKKITKIISACETTFKCNKKKSELSSDNCQQN